jgi:hypothetical protein
MHAMLRAVYIFVHFRVRKRKTRERSHSEANVAVGYQRIGASK